jgi:hypothetical protein
MVNILAIVESGVKHHNPNPQYAGMFLNRSKYIDWLPSGL